MLACSCRAAPRFTPCTPWGCLELIKTIEPDITGLNVVIIGRSLLVGRQLAALLTNASATVTLAHGKTRDLPDLCRRADILVAAVGKAHFVS